jgi:hypothetical protein
MKMRKLTEQDVIELIKKEAEDISAFHNVYIKNDEAHYVYQENTDVEAICYVCFEDLTTYDDDLEYAVFGYDKDNVFNVAMYNGLLKEQRETKNKKISFMVNALNALTLHTRYDSIIDAMIEEPETAMIAVKYI